MVITHSQIYKWCLINTRTWVFDLQQCETNSKNQEIIHIFEAQPVNKYQTIIYYQNCHWLSAVPLTDFNTTTDAKQWQHRHSRHKTQEDKAGPSNDLNWRATPWKLMSWKIHQRPLCQLRFFKWSNCCVFLSVCIEINEA